MTDDQIFAKANAILVLHALGAQDTMSAAHLDQIQDFRKSLGKDDVTASDLNDIVATGYARRVWSPPKGRSWGDASLAELTMAGWYFLTLKGVSTAKALLNIGAPDTTTTNPKGNTNEPA